MREKPDASGWGPLDKRLSRRDVLMGGAALGVGAAIGKTGLTSRQGRLIESALASSGGSSIRDIQHVVILMQENRSFDHYFGTMPGVRGFNDKKARQSYSGGPKTNPSTVFNQTMVSGSQTLYQLADGETSLGPFELFSNPPTVDGQTTNDITHDWGPQHMAWNDGSMDQFAVQHLMWDGTAPLQLSPPPGQSNVPNGITTMGYYRSADLLTFYRALAESFTICDGYHCSVLGPTDPNRLMWMSGTIGATGLDAQGNSNGGPILETYVQTRPEKYGTLSWKTMPEVLTDNSVSWKVYQDPTSTLLFNVLPYFSSFFTPSTPTEIENAANGLTPVYPAGFAADVVAGTLPQVSWIMPPLPNCEHPAVPPAYGEYLVSEILETLLLNPDVWATTVFLVLYDENGGFFDHVPPPTPGPLVTLTNGVTPPSSSTYAGEYTTAAALASVYPTSSPGDSQGVLGPVGLGFRVPCLVVSPFSAGGWLCPDLFDHVSTLKFIEKLFLPAGTLMGSDGLEISPWRYNTVGNMSAALPALHDPVDTVPTLPATSMTDPDVAQQALINALLGTEDYGVAYPPPTQNNGIPGPDQDSTKLRRTPK
jgi:phospholipase C